MFSLSRASGDPRNVYLDEYATDEMYEAWGVKLGLDKPLYVQYLTWLGDVMVGDFGESLYHKRNPFDLIKERLPATVSLAAIAFCQRSEWIPSTGCDSFLAIDFSTGCDSVLAICF